MFDTDRSVRNGVGYKEAQCGVEFSKSESIAPVPSSVLASRRSLTLNFKLSGESKLDTAILTDLSGLLQELLRFWDSDNTKTAGLTMQ